MIDNLKGIDIYLLDLLLKGFIHGNQEILDAGCGTGRNIKYFLSQNMHVTGVDSDAQCIVELKNQYPEKASRFIHSSIEEFENGKNYDVIIGMYHDQVLTPMKALFGFDAINITLGLPFVRISPDHGPNSSMLGKNLSNPKSLIEALKFLDK